jgi:hypothetical protein
MNKKFEMVYIDLFEHFFKYLFLFGIDQFHQFFSQEIQLI